MYEIKKRYVSPSPEHKKKLHNSPFANKLKDMIESPSKPVVLNKMNKLLTDDIQPLKLENAQLHKK